MSSVMGIAGEMAKQDPILAPEVLEVLRWELAVHSLHYLRVDTRLELALHHEDADICVDAVREFTEHVPWYREFLERRPECHIDRRRNLMHKPVDSGLLGGRIEPEGEEQAKHTSNEDGVENEFGDFETFHCLPMAGGESSTTT